MDKCQNCGSERLAIAQAHGKDCCWFNAPHMMEKGLSDYMPNLPNLGGGDDVAVDICLECGQVQGSWPITDGEIQDRLTEDGNQNHLKEKYQQEET